MRSMVEGACDATMPLPPHFVRSPLPAFAGREVKGTHRRNSYALTGPGIPDLTYSPVPLFPAAGHPSPPRGDYLEG